MSAMSNATPGELAARVASSVDPRRLWRDLETLSQWDRHSGGQGERQAAAYVAAEMRSAGLDVEVLEFDSLISLPGRAGLEVTASASGALELACKTHSFAAPTAHPGIEAEAVWEDDAGADARGRILVYDGLVHPRTVLDAQERGAVGAVFVNPDAYLHEMIVTTVWGTPTPADRERLPRIPVVSVSRPDGERLAALRPSGPVRLRLRAEVETRWRRLPLPVARVGPRDGDFLLVGAHIDSWHAGSTDNATGDASVMELARVLQPVAERLRRGFWFCWWPGHSTGRYSGSAWFADAFHRQLRERCLVYFNIDSPGVRGASEYVARHTSGELEVFNRARIQEVTNQRVDCQRPSRVADQSFLNMGVPSLAAYSFLPSDHPDRRAYTGGSAGAWWWHNEADTPDKADPDVLAFDTRLAARILVELAARDVVPFSFSRVAADLTAAAGGLAAVAGDAWDPTELVGAVEAFAAAAADFDAFGERLARQPRAAGERAAAVERGAAAIERHNRIGVRVSRIVNPAAYSARGAAEQDPADRRIALRGVDNPALPTLRELQRLTGEDLDEDERGFLRTRLQREQNRVTGALHEAVRELRAEVEAAATG